MDDCIYLQPPQFWIMLWKRDLHTHKYRRDIRCAVLPAWGTYLFQERVSFPPFANVTNFWPHQLEKKLTYSPPGIEPIYRHGADMHNSSALR
jgi:hypothetical protein